MASPRPQYSNQGYLPNGTTSGPTPGAQPLLPNNGRVIQSGPTRVLCIADVRGNLRSLNDLARVAKADYIIHTGDFGFYDESSLERIADKTLKHVAQYSPLISENVKRQISQQPPQRPIKTIFPPDQLPLSELPLLLNKQITLEVPVYTVWGACEDVRVLERFRSGEYKVDKLYIIDEVNSRLLDIGGVKLRLLGLGGAVVIHKLFDNGEGKTYIAGGQGTMWTTLLQIGALIDTANRVYDPSETRIFVTHASPARDGILNQLSVTLKADFSISAGLHFRYGSSYNEFSVNPSLDHYRGKLAASKASFNDVWETVKMDVEQAIASNDSHKALLQSALDIVEKMPTVANGGNPFGGPVAGNTAAGQVDESAFKNMWNFNLADAAFGYLVLEIESGRIGTEMRAQGFNFAHRSGKPNLPQPIPQQGAAPAAVSNTGVPQNLPTGPVQNRQQPMFNAVQSPFPQPQQGLPPQQQPAASRSQPQAQPQPAKPSHSPAPAQPITQAKPLTPQPPSTNVNAGTANAATPLVLAPATNGTGAADKPSDGEGAKGKPSTPVEKKSPTTILVSHVDTEQAAKDLFTSEDLAKAKSINPKKAGLGGRFTNYVFTFESHEIAEEVMLKVRAEAEKKPGGKSPRVGWDDQFRSSRQPAHSRESQSQSTTGNWQSSNRGAANASPSTRGGYQSGGASDSEGGRGRGGYRGRGGRGQDRGGRGARGGGRGGFPNKPADSMTGEAKPAASEKPVTSTTPAPEGA